MTRLNQRLRTVRRATTEPLEARQLFASGPLPVTLHVNAGGPAFTDNLGRPFEGDVGFAGGSVGTQTVVDPSGGPADPVYSTYRQGREVTFSRPVAPGNYALFLHFADSLSTVAGQRRIDVFGEGTQVLDDFDALTHGDPGVAVVKVFDLPVVDGALDLRFTGVVGDAIVSGLTLVPIDVPPEAQPYSWAGLSDAARTLVSASSLRRIGQEIVNYANEHRGEMPGSLSATFFATDTPISMYASPRTDTSLPRGELSHLEATYWVSSRRDFVYTGSRDLRTLPPDFVVAYENPGRVAGDISVLFADGHVETLARAAAGRLLGFDGNASYPGGTPFRTSLPANPAYVQSQTHLRNVGSSLLMWANERRGVYPETPGDLVYVGASASWFVNPRGNGGAPPAGMTQEQAKAFINAADDYRYIGTLKRTSSAQADVIAFEDPSAFTDGISLLFNDGSTEFREHRWALEMLRRSSLRIVSGAADVPVAEVAGIGQIVEGTSAQLAGAGIAVLRPGPTGFVRTPIVRYAWDLNYDGTSFQVDATGMTAALNAAGIDGPATRTVALRVTDAAGATSAPRTLLVRIRNAAPLARFSSDGVVAAGAASTVRFSAVTDAPADVAAGFRYSYDFNNDGDFADAGDVAGSTSATASFTYAAAGTFTVRGRVADQDGGHTDYTAAVTVNPAAGGGGTPVTYQGETLTLGGGTVANAANRGYTGTGYADFAGAGSWAQLAVNRPAAGAAATLSIRYANGSAASRPYDLLVNGVKVGRLAAPPTGSGSTWRTELLGSNVSLAAGANAIRLVAVGAGADLDSVTLTPLTTTPPPPPPRDPPVTLQGESATLGGGTAANSANRGYSGSGYADFAGAGSYAQFTVTRTAAGAATLSIRYANGSAASRPFNVLVNGVAVGQLACPPTGSGSAWSTLSLLTSVSLLAGSNTIRLVAVGAGADLDQLTVAAA
jgi:prepilin-type processing-associated H-X9-DG protein